MKEGGYFNPFLNKLIKVDRNEYFKKLSLDRKNINFIDFIKSNRNYSQNQNITRYISNDTDMDVDLFDNIEPLEADTEDVSDSLLDSGDAPSEENIDDLELESQDLSDFADSNEEDEAGSIENNEEFPTEAFEDLESQDLDLEQDDLLGEDIDLSADDMLMDDETAQGENPSDMEMNINAEEEQEEETLLKG